MASKRRTKRILIVDDDQGIRRVLSESLRLLGYDISSFENAEDALEAIQQENFQLALLDINLPGINGLQLCREIRSLSKSSDIPIIMMTAFYKEAAHIREARETYGATDYLLKPFPLKELHERIAQLLGPSSSEDHSTRLSVEGNLKSSPLPTILHNLYELRATGLLHLENKEVKKIVYIRNGYPIFVRSNLVREFLGQILVRKGLINQETLEESLTVAKERGQKHGMALVEMGLITAQQLDDVLHRQIVDKLLESFSWAEGKYQFVQAREFKQNVTSIDMSPANIILEGLRDYAPRDTVQNILKPHMGRYLHFVENPLYRFQEITFSASEQRILNNLKGDKTVHQVISEFALSRKVAEPLLAALVATGIMTSEETPVQDRDDRTSDVPEEELTKRDSFLKEYALLMEQDYFSLLGVRETDPPSKARKAYYRLVKKYHPDRFFEQDLLIDLKDKVHSLFQHISEAHETLTNPQAKSRYLAELKGKEPSTETSLESILAAEKEFHRGMVLLRVNKFADAKEAFAEALKGQPDENEYLMYHAWSGYKANPGSEEERNNARSTLTKTIERSPKLSKAHLYLGYISKDQGRENEAIRHFEKTIQLDPNCIEALRELRLLFSRKEQGKPSKGLLGKFRKT